MQFPKAAKVEAVVSADQYRGALTQVFLDVTQPDNPRLIATDGHALAVVPVQAESTEGGFVPVAALKAARKAKGNKTTGTLNLNGNASLPTGETWPREELGPFPAWRNVMPIAHREGSVKISLNAQLLHNLADALGSDALILDIVPSQPLSAIRVTVAGSENVGVLMPIRVK